MFAETVSANSSEAMALRRKLAVADEEIRQLRAIIGANPSVEFVHNCKRVLGLTRARAVVLSMLMSGKVSTREGILRVYCPNEDQPEPQVVNVMVYHIRKALKPHGVKVENIHGQGYRIDEHGRQKLALMLCEGM